MQLMPKYMDPLFAPRRISKSVKKGYLEYYEKIPENKRLEKNKGPTWQEKWQPKLTAPRAKIKEKFILT